MRHQRGALVVRRITVLAAAGAVGVAIALGSFVAGRALRGPDPVARATATKVADADLVSAISLPPVSQSTPPLASGLGSTLSPPGGPSIKTARPSTAGTPTVGTLAITT